MSAYLTPPSLDRPTSKRLLTLQPTRPSPYAYPFSPSSSSSPSPTSPSTGLPRRPTPKRALSFCGDSSTPTFALASTSSSYFSADRTHLVAPPLERTLSSIGCAGNRAVGGMMERPNIGVRRQTQPDLLNRKTPFSNKLHSTTSRLPTPPESPVPTINIVENTPPKSSAPPRFPSPSPTRPHLQTMRTSSSTFSDSSVVGPQTPISSAVMPLLGGGVDQKMHDEDEVEDLTESVDVLVV